MTPEDKIKFIVKAISAQILSRTIVIYSFRYNRYFAHCNGVLFRENDKTYILTAEHVFRKMLHGELKIFLNGFLLYLEGEIIGNPSYDIAIFEIDKKLEPFLLNKYKFLYKNQLLFNHKPEAKQKYFLIGYPSSKVTIRESKIEEKPIIYYTTALVNQLNKNEIEFTYN